MMGCRRLAARWASNSEVRVSATADTANIISAGPSIPCIVPSQVTISIAGLGTVSATGSSYVFDAQTIGGVWGFGEGTCSGGADWLDVSDAGALTYAPVSNLAPTTGTQFDAGTAEYGGGWQSGCGKRM